VKMPDYTLTARAPFGELALAGVAGDGVLVADRGGLGIASVLVRKNKIAALAECVRAHFGIELPRGPRRSARGAVAFAATGPGTWLATREEGGTAFAASLIESIGDIASVADQSSGYAILRVTGPKLRDTLAKILPIDLHERAFAPGAVASTNASHVGVTLWRLENAGDGSPVFEIAMFRSLAGSFWHGFAASAAEFGVGVTTAPVFSIGEPAAISGGTPTP
jgi:heterotetrameric sarcosine oxidase gamma subunit